MPDGTEKQNLPAIAKPPLASGGKIAAIVPTSFESAYRLAGVFAASGMVPKAYVDRSGAANRDMICVAIMHGMELGLTPMAALQSIAVINNSPTIWGDGMIALVEASGLLEDKEERVECDNDGTPLIAICRVKRVGRKQWVEQTFTQVEARKAGLWSKQGPWTQYPRRMMQMRARSWALRDAFPDVLRGLGSAEEARDMIDIGGGSTIPPEPTRDQFRAKVTDADADQNEQRQSPGDNGTLSAGETSGETTTSQSTSPEDPPQEEPDWVVPNGPTEKQLEAFVDVIGAARGPADFDAIRKTNEGLLKKWATGKKPSAYATALDTVEAAFAEKAKKFET